MTQWTFSWTALLVAAQRLPQAIRVARQALQNDPLNDRLCGLLYRLQGQSSAVQARQVLTRFAEVLRSEGYCEEEVAELIAGITTEPCPEHRTLSSLSLRL
ncbi:hypothetical protein Pcar_0141 [Syntrophotalea carbinolica DSM 2380]|uniref:Bacterial transcriptional activator domain-containing protein n=1 Tax=Syntrophotalea carbinolica (strain DSM 2380 / NBRC 103641 / GraBd1) TaxID=338963 RepID=Q3A890_SYNC1|nr:hypothetical protein [Syntrophotalea carbinolica]ABA87402.1 hypothetical protein Pcar_0141 [Syntrophotalea carbinolica DSM 2380]